MKIELGKTYVDRDNKLWLITSVNGPSGAPVTGERRGCITRTFQRDGHWADGEDRWDLIREATADDSRRD